MLKDTALRKKMAELGLSTAGSRQMLEKRHQEWMTIWNANCDSAKPKKRSELLQDLETWERTMGSRAPTLSRAANVGAQIKDKDFDGAAWAAKHDTSFKDLIARARSSKSAVAQKADEGKSNEGSKEPVPGRDDGRSMNGAVLQHGSSADVVDLTEPPPSSQLASPDSPSKGRSPAKESTIGILGDSGVFLGQGMVYPPDSIPTFSPSRGP
jgi:E3 ubiquitin-protein ligase RAD18